MKKILHRYNKFNFWKKKEKCLNPVYFADSSSHDIDSSRFHLYAGSLEIPN